MIDIDKIGSRLREYSNQEKQSQASRHLWKPTEGVQAIRIVPYKATPTYPFIELKFYYKLNGRTFLAPCTFGKPDPILEFVDTLRASGVQSQRELAKKLAPVSRTYVPIVVRKQEDQGVKFWGFGPQVHRQLLNLTFNVTMWGDITSLVEGNDLQVEFHKVSAKKTADGQVLPETIITPDPRKTPAVDPSRPDLMQKIKDQVDILSIWTLPEYAELKEALDRHINPQMNMSTAHNEPDNGPDDTAPDAHSSSVTPAPAAADVGQAFADFFKK